MVQFSTPYHLRYRIYKITPILFYLEQTSMYRNFLWSTRTVSLFFFHIASYNLVITEQFPHKCGLYFPFLPSVNVWQLDHLLKWEFLVLLSCTDWYSLQPQEVQQIGMYGGIGSGSTTKIPMLTLKWRTICLINMLRFYSILLLACCY